MRWLALLFAGCASTAGPFVTSIQFVQPNVIVVTKCTVEFSTSPWNHIEQGQCFNETVIPPGYGPPNASTSPPSGSSTTRDDRSKTMVVRDGK